MIKHLLNLIGLAAISASAIAGSNPKLSSRLTTDDQIQTFEFPADISSAKPVTASNDNTFDYNLAADPYQALTMGALKGHKVAMAFEMPPEVTTEFAGNKITHISFWTGVNKNTGLNDIKEVTIFLSEGDHKTAFYTQTVPVGTERFGHYTAELTEPYTIEAGKDLYVGCYSIVVNSADLPIVVDNVYHSTDVGGWTSTSASESSNFRWKNVTSQYGYVCVSATLQGNNFPQNKASLEGASAPEFVEAQTDFPISLAVMNLSQKPLQSIDVEYSVNGGTPQSAKATFREAVNSLQVGECSLSGVKVPAAGEYKISLKLSKINGVSASNTSQAEVTVKAMPQGAGVKPNVVMEEFTGTWCQYCPVGYITMEYIHEHYTDGTLIPVCIHMGDEMQSDSYAAVENRFNTNGYPSSIINRSISTYPFPVASIEALYNELREQKTPLSVSLKCNFTDDSKSSVVFEGKTMSCIDLTNHNYVLSFGLTEDNVGPYVQNNAYTGKGSQYGQWNNPGGPQNVVFNDVARKLESVNGIDGLIPASISANRENPYTYTMTVPDGVKAENLNGIVYLTDKTTGQIMNAATVKAGKFGLSAVKDISRDDATAPVEYFNLQGVKVDNPSNGLYIRRQGTQTTKVILK